MVNWAVRPPNIVILMKKLFILFFTLVSVTFASSAQLGEKTTFGLRAGVGFGGFSSSDAYLLIGGTKASNWDFDNKNKITYNAGAIVDIPVYRKWGLSFQTGLWFTERHTTFKGKNAHNSSTWRDMDLKAMYLQVPIQLGYHYNFNVVNVQALFGPFLEYRVGDGKSKSNFSSNGGIQGKGDAFSDKDKNFSYGLTFGLGAEYKHMYLGVKYDLGLTNYYSGSNEDRKDKQDLNLKGNMFSIVLGWNF